jgi:hypothetical protein
VRLGPCVTPSLNNILRGRYWTSTGLRIAALLMVIWGALRFVEGVLWTVPQMRDLAIPALAGMAVPLRWVVLAVVLIALEGRLIRWLFPLPRVGCPQCGYPIAGRAFDRCPECGLVLGEANGGVELR